MIAPIHILAGESSDLLFKQPAVIKWISFEFMFERGLTDGLPVIPPTPDRVARMLSGTRRDPREVVAVLPPNLAPVTIEKIAANAVMAGCRPEYLPVVLAAIEAVATPEFNAHGIMSTTWGATPVIVVNGPIRRAIDMNMGMMALGFTFFTDQ